MVPEPSIRSPPIPFNGVETGWAAEYMASSEGADQALEAVASAVPKPHNVQVWEDEELDGCVERLRCGDRDPPRSDRN